MKVWGLRLRGLERAKTRLDLGIIYTIALIAVLWYTLIILTAFILDALRGLSRRDGGKWR